MFKKQSIQKTSLIIKLVMTISLIAGCSYIGPYVGLDTSVPEPDVSETPRAQTAESKWSRAERALIQTGLNRLGFNTQGEVDGTFGENTRSAIIAWQEAGGDVVTGYLSINQGSALLTTGQQEIEQASEDVLRPALDTDEEAFLDTDEETFLDTDEEAFLDTDEEAFLDTDEEAFLDTDEEAFLDTDEEAFLVTDEDLSEGTQPRNFNLQSLRDCDECPEMVMIPPGRVSIGSPLNEGDRISDEGPVQKILVKSFAVSKYEITFKDWEVCVSEGGCNEHVPEDYGWGRDNRPVVDVSWQDAKAYVSWLSQKTGQTYRLLTEAEWEYVARAGTRTRYWWGEDSTYEEICKYANSADQAIKTRYPGWKGHAPCHDQYVYTSPVGSFTSNPFGLFDILGNVWEWVDDCWRDTYAQSLPEGPCEQRVLRGGSWSFTPTYLRSARRFWSSDDTRSNNYGIRVGRNL